MKGLTGECLRHVRKCVFPLWQMEYVQDKVSDGLHIRIKPWWRNEFSEMQHALDIDLIHLSLVETFFFFFFFLSVVENFHGNLTRVYSNSCLKVLKLGVYLGCKCHTHTVTHLNPLAP